MISLNLSKIDQTIKNNIIKKCVYMPPKSQYNDSPQPIYCFKVNKTENTINIPMGLWRDFEDGNPEFPNRIYPSAKFTFNKELLTKETDPKKYRDQDVVFNEAITRLEKEHTIFLNLPTGFGKTFMGTKLINHFGLSACILSYSEKIRDQWEVEIKGASPDAKVQNVKNGKLKKGMDIYIIGSLAAATISPETLDNIGLVIVDEIHQVVETTFSQSLLNFQPKYLIGLSATTKRADGLHNLFELYFGKPTEFIKRKEVKDFTVYKVNTPFKPEIKYNTYRGKTTLDFTTLSNSLAFNKKRNDFIISLIKKHPERKIYVMVDRVEACKYIFNTLKNENKNVGILKGTDTKTAQEKKYYDDLTAEEKKEYNKKKKEENKKFINDKPLTDYDVIIATKQAGGTGINIPTLDMAIIGFSCKEGIDQYEGRLRTQNCIIYDLVDDFGTLENHWKIRNKWYVGRGAEIKYLKLDLNGLLSETEIKPENNENQERKRYLPETS